MTGGKQLIDQIEMQIGYPDKSLVVYMDIWDNSLSRKWLSALDRLLLDEYYLEKNYCFLGFADGPRTPEYILQQINRSIDAINQCDIGYHIDDHFDMSNAIEPGTLTHNSNAGLVDQSKFNNLHRYFEDLQGTDSNPSRFYQRACTTTRWHIRQLNLLCHEFESLMLSIRKKKLAPEWQRPSQLMCWLNAPRFNLEPDDYELFGLNSINRTLGGIYVGINKAVGKHHWEVFVDEANYDPDFIANDLITTVLRGQTVAAGDFDIEWANNPGEYAFQIKHLIDFETWLIKNGFDPQDKSLTIGHPQIGQVDLERSFHSSDYMHIWKVLSGHLNVLSIQTSRARAEFLYNWTDAGYEQQQIEILSRGHKHGMV